MAGDDGREEAFFGEDALAGDADGEYGGLGVGCFAQFFFRAVEAEAAEGETQGVVGFGEGGAGFFLEVAEVFAHADGLRALAGKDEGDFRH